MKFIQKLDEPETLRAWKQQDNENWHPSYEYLRGVEKKALKEHLMQEQGYICCYCECRLKSDDSHIEHVIPQSLDRDKDLDYRNMLCSCQKPTQKRIPLHCGNRKGKWFEQALFISPLDPTCERRFKFTADGHIYPTDENDEAAKVTIEKLGLDLPILVKSRAAAIDAYLNILAEDSTFSIAKELELDSKGKFIEYWSTIKAVLL